MGISNKEDVVRLDLNARFFPIAYYVIPERQ